MTRLYTVAIGALAIIAVCAALVLWGRHGAQVEQERDAAQDHIETRERMDDAMARPDGCAWPDRLRGTC